jgi:hypothetical protein
LSAAIASSVPSACCRWSRSASAGPKTTSPPSSHGRSLTKLRSDGDWRDNAAEAVASDPCSNHEPASARPPARGRCISAAWISRRARFDRNEECRPSIDSKDALKFNASIGVRSRIQTRLARAARPTIGDDHARSAFTAPEQKIRLLRAIDKSAPSRSAILDLAARR